MFGKCILCNAKKWKIFEEIEDRYQTIRFYECQRCGQVTQWPQLSPSEMRYFNNHLYRKDASLYELEKFEMRRAEAQFNIIDAPPMASIMDFGCSTGQLLHRFCKHWKTLFAVGVETNERVADFARASRLIIANGMYEIEPGAKFDLITAVHVLEHLLRPNVVLHNMKDRIAPGGELYVEVPNLLGDIALEKAHVHAFTEDSIVALLRVSGWEPIWVKKHGAPKHPWLECYISALAKSRDGFLSRALVSPGGMERKRKFAMLKRLFALATYRG